MTNAQRTEIKALFANATKVTVRNGGTAHIFIGDSEGSLEKSVMKEMVKGGTAKYSDGRSEWIDCREIEIPGEHEKASDAYIWAKDCNRTKHNRVLITKFADGTMTEKLLRPVYKHFGHDR